MTDDSCGRSNHIVCEGKMSGSLPAIFDRRTIIEDIFFLMLCIHRQYFQTT